jgi:uncharacterized protein
LIAYFDTSALVPLLVEEPTTPHCDEQWSLADRVVSVRLVEVEARSALAQAARQERLTPRQLRSSVQALALVVSQLDLVAIDDALVKRAGDLAEEQALRAYDAIHVAAALRVADEDLVVIAGDRALLDAASAVGLAVAATR